MTMLEKELERKLTNAIKAAGGYCPKWVSPGTTGLPDRIILLPGARIVFVEMKRPRGSKVGPLQTFWRRILTGLGFTHRVVYNEYDLHALLIELEVRP